MRVICAVLSLSMATPAVALQQVVEETIQPPVIDLDGEALFRARTVLRRFFREERRPACYRVLFSELDGNLTVEFIPKNQIIVLHEGEPLNEPPPCGRNVGYVIDRSGRVLRRLYSR
jgi:hypothetical protein